MIINCHSIKSSTRLYILLLCSMFAHGCSTIDEDFTDCITLDLKYEYHMESVDFTEIEFLESVDYVELYIFDKELKLTEHIRVPSTSIEGGHLITVPLSYVGNTMVTWAREMLGSYDITPLKLGDSIDLLRLTLKRENNHSSKELGDLFYGGREVMQFAGVNQTHTINFMRKDKRIHISLNGKANITDYAVKLTAQNGTYASDNSIVANTPTITYLPTNQAEWKTKAKTTATAADSAKPTANIHTLRLLKSQSEDVKLTIINQETGLPIRFAGKDYLKLIEYLLLSKPSGMDDQEYLDRNSAWDISFDIDRSTNIALSITINAWTMWFNSTDL